MFLQTLRAKIGARLNGDSEAGFTLIELLVVMLILGILAAIALPAFFNQRSKANDAKAKSYANSAETAMETCATENNGSYSACGVTALKAVEPTLSNAELAVKEPLAEKSYEITITAETTGDTFSVVRSEAGNVSYPCTASATNHGGCTITTENGTEGTWGK